MKNANLADKSISRGKFKDDLFDSAPTTNSKNLLESGVVKTALDGKLDNQSGVIQNSHLSTGCIKNGNILDNQIKVSKLSSESFDDEPTTNSKNLLTSGAIKNALDSVVEGYVKMEDLVDGLQVNEISAKDITIDGKKPSTEGHTHVVDDITDFPQEIVKSVNG